MSGRATESQWGQVVLFSARYLIALYLAVSLLQPIEWLPIESTVPRSLLFWVTVAFSLLAIIVRLRRFDLERIEVALRAARQRVSSTEERVVSLSARNLVIAFFGVIAVQFLGYPIRGNVAVGTLYVLVIGLLGTTMLLRDDRTSRLAAKVGATLLVVGLVVGSFADAVPTPRGAGGYVLGIVLVGLVLWNRHRHLAARARVQAGASDRRYLVLLGGLTALAVGVYFYRLGFQQLHGDEHQVVSAAVGFYHTGEFYRWDWITSSPRPVVYDRAWPHTVVIAASYEVFGISEWSSRLPSAIAGLLSVPLAYFVFRYFTERRRVAITASASLLLHPVLIDFFRWTRMYALLIPLFLVVTYLVHRALTGRNTVNLRSERANAYVERHLDYDLRFGVAALGLLALGTQIHRNVMFVVPGAYLFVLYRSLTTDQRRYAVASVLGVVGLFAVAALVLIFPYLDSLARYTSFFAKDHYVYVDYLLGYPLTVVPGVVLFAAGLLVVHRLEDGHPRSKLVYLYFVGGFSLVFLVYIGDRYSSFAYIVHVVPVGVALALNAFWDLVDEWRSDAVRLCLVLTLLVGMVAPLYVGLHGHDYRSQYLEDTQDFTTGYGTIERNYEQGQALFIQYPRRYYLRDLDPQATLVDMEYNQRYSPEEFRRDLARYDSGWLAWETRKSYHIHPEIREYADEHFVKLHGKGIDDTGVEVYYFNESMVEDVR